MRIGDLTYGHGTTTLLISQTKVAWDSLNPY